METKLPCGKCKQLLPASYEYFCRANNKKGFWNWCRKCTGENGTKYYYSHREEIAKKARIYYLKKRKHKLLYALNYRLKNADKINIIKEAWRLKNIDKVREAKKRWKTKAKLEKWMIGLRIPIIKPKFRKDCEICLMTTNPQHLYEMDGKWKCLECVMQWKDKNWVEGKQLTVKRTCTNCGRLTVDTRFPKCVDCRILEKQKIRNNYYSPF